ncbi:hypothetical protein [Methylocella sp.]|jgi:hypothetical protein|uniref:hypothetical protein n=1 Tax=Methylocella sp. TaxID=1978226 RepID=UPI003C1E56CC
MGDWNLDFVADQLQHAAFDPSAWSAALEDIGRRVGAIGAVLLSTDSMPLARPPSSPDLEGLMTDYFRGGWNQRDERYRGVPLAATKGVIVDQDFMSLEEIRRSAYYQDFLGRHDCPWFAGVGFKAGGASWGWRFSAPPHKDLFSRMRSKSSKVWYGRSPTPRR